MTGAFNFAGDAPVLGEIRTLDAVGLREADAL